MVFKNDIILSIFQDREGSLWVGTESGGLNLLKDKKFTTYTTREGLGSDLVKSIYEDRNVTESATGTGSAAGLWDVPSCSSSRPSWIRIGRPRRGRSTGRQWLFNES